MMDEMYLENLLKTIEDDLEDLVRWSLGYPGVSTDDENAILDLKSTYDDVRERLESLIKKQTGEDLV